MTKRKSILTTICVLALSLALAAVCAGIAGYGTYAAEEPVTAVTIDIDFGDYDGRNEGANLPHGKAGKSYPVFAYTAADNLGQTVDDVLVTVTAPDGSLVPQVKGRFETATAGSYILRYVATKNAVSAERTLKITVDEYADNIAYDGATENVPTNGTTGSAVFVVFGEFSGGTGDLTPYTNLTYGETELQTTTTGAGAYFVPEKCGEYVVTYGVVDFAGDEKKITKKITIEDPIDPAMGEVSLPGSAISGDTLDLPLPDAIFYRGGKKTYVPVKATFDGEDVTSKMKVENLAVGEHEIVYSCVNPLDETREVKRGYTLVVKDKNVAAEAKLFDNYFDLTNCVSDKTNNVAYSVAVTANADSTPFDASASFARALPVEYANLELSATAAFAAYKNAYFVVTDSKNAAEKIMINISRLTSLGSVWLSYDEATSSIVNRNGGATLTEVERYADGTKFAGFSSGNVYVSFEFTGVTKDIYLSLTKVGSVVITTGSADYTPPTFVTNPDYRSVYVANLGHKVYLPEMQAFDLLDKNVSVTLTVRKPDGSLVFEGQGGYTLDVTESGEYSVEYTARDYSGNVRKLVSGVYVTDLESPVIKVSGIKKTVKVGEEITLPKAEITDNDTSADKILSYVYVLKGNFRKELAGETYTFTEAGEYKIRYVAYDANQNYTVVEFTVICK